MNRTILLTFVGAFAVTACADSATGPQVDARSVAANYGKVAAIGDFQRRKVLGEGGADCEDQHDRRAHVHPGKHRPHEMAREGAALSFDLGRGLFSHCVNRVCVHRRRPRCWQ